MEQLALKCAGREVLGKRVRFLRRQGITPVHVFGHGVESLSLQCETPQLQRILTRAGKTRLISLQLAKGDKARNVIVREVQRDAITGQLLHVDLYQVKATEKMKVQVPIVLVNEAPALKVSKEYAQEQGLDNLEVECLPADIPDKIEVDLSPLIEAEMAIRVKDLKLDDKLTTVTDPERVIVRIAIRRVEVEEVAPKEEVVAEAAAEGAEAGAPAAEAKGAQPEEKAEKPKDAKESKEK